MKVRRDVIGETLGTFLLVLLGCGSVAVAVLFQAHQGVLPVAVVWGVGAMLAIYLTRHLSCAHLNPAVTLAMVASGRMAVRKMPVYLASQIAGAFLAGLVLYALFAPSIAAFEAEHHMVRGSPESVRTAMMFGEFYPNPGCTAHVSFVLAMFAEALGTFLLVLMIFALTEGCNVGRPNDALAPVFIGLTVTSVICLIGPLTQAGLNPARDLGPRLVAWLMGWGAAAFPDRMGGFFHVYVLSPVVGAVAAARFFVRIVEPAMRDTTGNCDCKGGTCS